MSLSKNSAKEKLPSNPIIQLPDNWPAANAHMLELGRMTCLWGSLETCLNLSIDKLIGNNSAEEGWKSLILIAHSNFQQRIDIFTTLCSTLKSKHSNLTDYESIVKKLKTAQKARNKFSHNGVYLDESTQENKINLFSARGTLNYQIEIVHLKELQDCCRKIHEAMCALYVVTCGEQLPPIWERK